MSVSAYHDPDEGFERDFVIRSTDFFHSDLDLFLDDNVGLFISVNARQRS